MKKRSSLFILIILMLSLVLTGCTSNKDAAKAKAANQSQVVTTTLYSKHLGIDWNYDVYLPAGYNPKANKKYPVLFMLHGLYGNHRNLLERFNSQQIIDGLVHRTSKKMIVVFVDGFNSFYVNQKGGMQMETAIIKDLIPKINQTYKVATNPNQRAIGGISMGGYGAARLALKYPNQFSKAVMISPSVWYSLAKGNPIRANMHAFTDGKTNWSDQVYNSEFPTKYINNKSRNVKLYIETTSSDTTVPVKDVNHFVNDVKSQGINVKYVKDSGDNHNWTYWTKAAPKAYAGAIKELN